MEFILIPIVGLFGFYLKGITGTGPTTVIVSLGSLIIEPKSTIVLSAVLNVFGGLAMIKIDPIALSWRYWVRIAAVMVIGSIAGAAALKSVPNRQFQTVLGIVFLFTAFWFLFRTSQSKGDNSSPSSANIADLLVGTFGGFCGGFVGVNAPVLISYFGLRLGKRELRRLLVLIFIPAAIAQTATFSINGLLNSQVVLLALATLPAMLFGIHLGNRAFRRIPEKTFRRVLGLLLLIVSIQLIWESAL